MVCIVRQRVLVGLSILYLLCMQSTTVYALAQYIQLDGSTGKVTLGDVTLFDNATQATWNIWVQQTAYNSNATLIGKYRALTDARSFLIRTFAQDELSVILSQNGLSVGHYTSNNARNCGIRANNEWTLITITYNGNELRYYRNGVYCDGDQVSIRYLFPSTTDLDFGAGNHRYFNGSLDDIRFYNRVLSPNEIKRLYEEHPYGGRKGTGIPVLVYHRIGNDTSSRDTITPETFTTQMKYLDERGFTTITMMDYDKWRAGEEELPTKPVIITFDDGWSSTWEPAYSIMKKRGMVGTVFVVSSYADTSNYKTWDQLRIMQMNGWDLESHGVHHVNMLLLNESEFRKELAESKARITYETNVTPLSFVFPFHSANSTYTQICGDYYRLCWTRGSEPPNPAYVYRTSNGTDYLGLQRITITNETTLQQFKDIFSLSPYVIGQWKMNEGKGNITEDTSIFHNHGTLNGNARWATG